jgi:hypothetical protein
MSLVAARDQQPPTARHWTSWRAALEGVLQSPTVNQGPGGIQACIRDALRHNGCQPLQQLTLPAAQVRGTDAAALCSAILILSCRLKQVPALPTRRKASLTAMPGPKRAPLVDRDRILTIPPWFHHLKMEPENLWKPTRQCAITLSLTSLSRRSLPCCVIR